MADISQSTQILAEVLAHFELWNCIFGREMGKYERGLLLYTISTGAKANLKKICVINI